MSYDADKKDNLGLELSNRLTLAQVSATFSIVILLVLVQDGTRNINGNINIFCYSDISIKNIINFFLWVASVGFASAAIRFLDNVLDNSKLTDNTAKKTIFGIQFDDRIGDLSFILFLCSWIILMLGLIVIGINIGIPHLIISIVGGLLFVLTLFVITHSIFGIE